MMLTHAQTLSQKEHTSRLLFDKHLFEEQVERCCINTLAAFKHITFQHALFHILFFFVGFLELSALVLFFSILTKSTLFAFTLAGLCFTGFAYCVLLFYFQAKKPEQLFQLRSFFTEQCQSHLPFESPTSAYYHAHIHALYQLLSTLHRQEYTYYSLPSSFKTLLPLFQKFSIWMHWKDVHQMKEILLHLIIRSFVKLITLQPTDLETHAGLATAFLTLSKLYTDPRLIEPEQQHLWVSPEYHSAKMHKQFKAAAERAIEEFRILDAYAPNEPWVHAQLAAIYRALHRPQEEIKEYETILTISADNQDALFQLGVLYFEAGRSAAALQLYERLMQLNPTKAEQLLSHYGAWFEEDGEIASGELPTTLETSVR